MIHSKPHEFAGKIVRIKTDIKHPQVPDFGGSDFRVEDYWDRVTGGSWMVAKGNPACLAYAARTGFSRIPIPTDDEVLYGKIGHLGHLVHITEIDDDMKTEHSPTPWSVSNSGGRVQTDVTTFPLTICTLETIPLSITPEIEANAEFIVKACNCHDDLLEACKHALLDIEYLIMEYTDGSIAECTIPGVRDTIKELHMSINDAERNDENHSNHLQNSAWHTDRADDDAQHIRGDHA